MDKEEIVIKFIEDEQTAYQNAEQGSFYPSNHHHLKDIIQKIPSALSEEKISSLYYHLMRAGLTIKPGKQAHYSLLQCAFEKILYSIDEGYPRNSFPKLEAMFLFNATHTWEEGNIYETRFPDYLKYLKVIGQTKKYWTLHGMLNKPAQFISFSQDEKIIERAILCLQRLKFVNHGSLVTDLPFWGLIYILLLNSSQNALNAVKQFAAVDTATPEKTRHMQILAILLNRFPENLQLVSLLQQLENNYPSAFISE